jgi:hypothetical protein
VAPERPRTSPESTGSVDILLTQVAATGTDPSAIIRDFWAHSAPTR